VEDLADEIATNHDALACAIYQGDGVTESVDDFNDEVDAQFTALNAIAIKAINIEPQLRAMYAGRYDQEDIAAKLEELEYDVSSYECSCIEQDPDELVPDAKMAFDEVYWTIISPFYWDAGDEGSVWSGTDLPVDYPNLYSGPFTFPYDAPSNDCDIVVRVWVRETYAGTWYTRIRNYNTGEIMYSGFAMAGGEGANHWEERPITNGTPTLVKGDEYYVQVKVHGTDGYSQAISGVSIKPQGV
jgi:hypothetical protein